jgi:hypothetical protein
LPVSRVRQAAFTNLLMAVRRYRRDAGTPYS